MSKHPTGEKKHSLHTATTLAKITSAEMEEWLLQVKSSASSIAENLIPTSGAHSDALNIIRVCDKTQASVRRLKSIAKAADITNASDRKKIKVCNINLCIIDAVKTLIPEYEERNVKLEIKQPARQFPAKVAPAIITDVLVAVLTNALQASENDGTVTVDTLQRDVNGVPHTAVRIRDNGHGMSKEVKNRIFEPFFTTKSEKTSLGLGLPIASSGIEACGGFIRVRSQVGRGASFSIFIPLAESGEIKRAKKKKKRTEVIFVVDDRPDCLQTAENALKNEGYSLLNATNTNDALSMLDDNLNSLNLCIVDISLPGAGSASILKNIAQADKTIPLILTSGFSRDFVRGYMKGVSFTFLQKPFTDEQLKTAVRKALSSPRNQKINPGSSSVN